MSGTDTSGEALGRSADRRRLIALVHMDMVAFSRLMGLDDVGTLERLQAVRRDLIDPAMAEHGGRVVNTGGDSLLIAFDSVEGAVRYALKVQEQVPVLNGDQPHDRSIRFRIGINLGDTIADGTDLYGDAVNVAARLQAECPPGGICVSRSVRDHVHGRLGLDFEELGPLNLKNIERPIEAFVVSLGSAVAGLPRLSSTLRSSTALVRPRLSLLVAPIQGLGFLPEQEYLVQGITEDFTTDLSRIYGSVVIRRASENLASLRRTALELDVNYLIQGSIRKVSNRIAVNVQLVTTESGAHIWGERFGADLHDMADTQDEIVGRLVRIFSTKLIEDANRRIELIDPEEWSPADLVLRGRAFLGRPASAANLREALGHFEQALDRDPGSIGAKTGIASVLVANIYDAWSEVPEEERARVEGLLSEVLLDDGDNVEAHICMGMLRRIQGRLQDSRAELETAIGLAPNGVHAISQYGMTLLCLGEPELAMSHIERCLRLAPHDRSTPVNLSILGLCKILLGDIDGAIVCVRKSLASNPRLFYTHCFLAAALALQNELEEAADALRQAVKLRPSLASLSDRDTMLRESSPKYVNLWRKSVYTGLMRAGLPVIAPNFVPFPDI